MADKDGSGTLSKQECRSLLIDSLNAKVPEKVFEKLFKVKKANISILYIYYIFQEADKSGEGVLSADEFVEFFHVLNRRKDLYQIMQQ